LKALKEVLPYQSIIEDNTESKHGVACHALQSKAWNENLLRQITFIRNRLNDIIDRQREQVLSYIALRDSRTLAHNTREMALMAIATEKLGAEMHAMTRGMERDARLMKFLAELAAFFLLLTAIAVGLRKINHIAIGAKLIADHLRHAFLFFHCARALATPYIWQCCLFVGLLYSCRRDLGRRVCLVVLQAP
jgi:hypothetical protein